MLKIKFKRRNGFLFNYIVPTGSVNENWFFSIFIKFSDQIFFLLLSWNIHKMAKNWNKKNMFWGQCTFDLKQLKGHRRRSKKWFLSTCGQVWNGGKFQACIGYYTLFHINTNIYIQLNNLLEICTYIVQQRQQF